MARGVHHSCHLAPRLSISRAILLLHSPLWCVWLYHPAYQTRTGVSARRFQRKSDGLSPHSTKLKSADLYFLFPHAITASAWAQKLTFIQWFGAFKSVYEHTVQNSILTVPATLYCAYFDPEILKTKERCARLQTSELKLLFQRLSYTHILEIWFLYIFSYYFRQSVKTFIRNNSDNVFNPLTPNDPCRGRTAPPTSKRFILYIYSTNIGTEYFKHGMFSPFFSLQNAVCFIILTYLGPVLFTFSIQDVLKFKNNSGAKRLNLRLQDRAYLIIEQLIFFPRPCFNNIR
jgi:hypothetical protein